MAEPTLSKDYLIITGSPVSKDMVTGFRELAGGLFSVIVENQCVIVVPNLDPGTPFILEVVHASTCLLNPYPTVVTTLSFFYGGTYRAV